MVEAVGLEADTDVEGGVERDVAGGDGAGGVSAGVIGEGLAGLRADGRTGLWWKRLHGGVRGAMVVADVGTIRNTQHRAAPHTHTTHTARSSSSASLCVLSPSPFSLVSPPSLLSLRARTLPSAANRASIAAVRSGA